jgi:predicted double-glycine peptidase
MNREAGMFHRIGNRNRASILVGAVLSVALCAGVQSEAAARGPVRSLLEMRHENVVIQKWDLSCGAAALTTVLNYQYEDPVTEKEIAKSLINRQEYLDNPKLVQFRQGFSLLDLKRVAEQRGYRGIGLGKMELEDLMVRAPILVPIVVNGYNHFVVFRGVMGDRVLVADPAFGNRTMRIQKFEDAWIDYPEFGKVGFVVARRDGGEAPPNQLAPRTEEFVMLR